MLDLWASGPSPRSTCRTTVRVRASMEHCRDIPVLHAAREMHSMPQRGCRAGTLGRGEVASHDLLCALPRDVGKADVLARGGESFLHELAERLCRRQLGRCLWPETPRFIRHLCTRDRRDSVQWRPQIPNTCLPDRCRLPAIDLDWEGAIGRDDRWVLHLVRQEAMQCTSIRVQ